MSNNQLFQQKYLEPLTNEKCEFFARCLAKDANYIRDPMEDGEFLGLPDDARHAFREMAAEYAQILDVDAHSPAFYPDVEEVGG